MFHVIHLKCPIDAPYISNLRACVEEMKQTRSGVISILPISRDYWAGVALVAERELQAIIFERFPLLADDVALERATVASYAVPHGWRPKRPLFIIAAPRSGSTLLYELLTSHAECMTIGREGNDIFEAVPSSRLIGCGNYLDESDLNDRVSERISAELYALMRDKSGSPVASVSRTLRLVEKTPSNTLRVRFLAEYAPDAQFVFLYREPWSNISSILDGWRTKGLFETYRVNGRQWKFLLPPGWADMLNWDDASIAARQWQSANEAALRDLATVGKSRCIVVKYDSLVTDWRAAVKRICAFAELPLSGDLDSATLPLSRTVTTVPHRTKWHRNRDTLERLIPSVSHIMDEVRVFEENHDPCIQRT